MLKLRIQSLPDESAAFIAFLRAQPDITVLAVSEAYANRGASHYRRVYVEIEMHSQAVSHPRCAKLTQEAQ